MSPTLAQELPCLSSNAPEILSKRMMTIDTWLI